MSGDRSPDYSTIDLARLAALGVYKRPATYHVDSHTGSACYLDPPGFPSYFVRDVWTSHGNYPGRGAVQVIRDPEGVDHPVRDAKDPLDGRLGTLLRSLWKPLPLDHPRTRLWIRAVHSHLKDCYADPDRPGGRPLVYPIPSYELREFVDDPRFSDEWRAQERAAVARANADLEERAKRLATPDNHLAVRRVREFYPEYQPEPDLIRRASVGRAGDWWETESAAPSPETCRPRSVKRTHPVNGTWCQWCGWTAPEAAAEAPA